MSKPRLRKFSSKALTNKFQNLFQISSPIEIAHSFVSTIKSFQVNLLDQFSSFLNIHEE